MTDMDGRQLQLKEDFTRQRGYWSELWDGLLRRDPDFFEAYKDFSSVPWLRRGLDPKVRELLYVAIDASTTHLYDPGTKIHMINAFRYGATEAEVLEVLELTSTLGVQTLHLGLPILMEELVAAGKDTISAPPLSEKQEQLKQQFLAAGGDWGPSREAMLRLIPDYFEACLRFEGVPWTSGPLEPKVKEFIGIALNASCTHLQAGPLRTHIRNALRHGATAQEITEIFELISVLGIHAITASLPILEEVSAAAAAQKG